MRTAPEEAQPPGGTPEHLPLRLVRETPVRWRIEPTGGMRVPGIVFASSRLLADVAENQSLQQGANVATLSGIVRASYAMPNVHWGYGFPIGGVAATKVDGGGVVSPGGAGFDICCGVRLLLSRLDRYQLAGRLPVLMDTLDRCEDGGSLADADPGQVSDHARARGLHQVGSLGSGNHFLEVQVVDRVYDPATAQAFGLAVGRVCVMIHAGSRGLGHQVCADHADQSAWGQPVLVPDDLRCGDRHHRERAVEPRRRPDGP